MMGPFDFDFDDDLDDDEFKLIRTEPEEYDSREEYELEHGPIDDDEAEEYWDD